MTNFVDRWTSWTKSQIWLDRAWTTHWTSTVRPWTAPALVVVRPLAPGDRGYVGARQIAL
jgi:hypothetical protein